MKPRHEKHHAVVNVLLATSLGLSVQPLFAASDAAESVIRGAARAGDVELPATAMKGTGFAGQFNPAALASRGVSLTLPDGRVITAKRQRSVEDKAKGLKTWVGTFDGQPGSLLVMTTFRGSTTGFVTYGTETWELVPGKAGAHLLYRVDESKFPKTEPMLYGEATSKDIAATSDYGTGGASADALTGGYVHTMLVVYTPSSKARWGQATLESMVQNALQAANQAYQNSQIGITLSLVGLQEIQYTETGDISTSAYDLKGATDGKMDGVHAIRDSVGADMVALISEDSNACGVAFTMRTESTSHASSAFGVVNSGCMSQHSLAHELGHIQGNQHDRASSSNVGVFPYSYGFRVCDTTDGSGFRTVMAYPCNGAPRVTQFSNPNVTFNGYATGIAYETSPTGSADNSRSMNNSADTVSAFRGTATGGGGGTASAPAAPSALTASAVSSTNDQLRWTDNSSDETGFKVERSSDGVTFAEIATASAGTTSYSDSGLAARTTYYYRVRAYNSVGNSGFSNTSSVTTPDTPPVAPASVAAVDGANGAATVSWADSSVNESSFEVRRETWDSAKSVWTGARTVATVPSGVVNIVDQAGNGTYRYAVRAVNGGGASAYAGPAQTTVTGGTTTNTSPGKGRKPR